MRSWLFALVLPINTVLPPSPVTAQQLSERAAEVSGASFVRAFLGHCGQNVGSYDRVISAASALGFSDLPPNLEPLMKPDDPNAEFTGFLAIQGEASPYFLGVSRSMVEGRSHVSCAVANPYIETESVVAALGAFAGFGVPRHDETEMGQRYREWTMPSHPGAIVSLTDAQPMGYEGATIALTAPEER